MIKIRNFENGKMVTSGRQFLSGSAAVAEGVAARLQLIKGEYLPDTQEGFDFYGQVSGKGSPLHAESAIQNHILGSSGVTGITSYSQSIEQRTLKATIQISDIYGGLGAVSYAQNNL